MFGALEGASPDPNDPATKTCTPPPGRDYTKFLKADGLKGARIGIPRAYFYDRSRRRADDPRGGLNPEQTEGDGRRDRRAEGAGRDRRRSGDIPSVVDKDPKDNLLLWGVCGGEETQGKDTIARSFSSTG